MRPFVRPIFASIVTLLVFGTEPRLASNGGAAVIIADGGPNGLVICSAARDQASPRLARGPAGFYHVAWEKGEGE